MKKIALMISFSLIVFSCENNTFVPTDPYNLHGTGKIKTKNIYSSSTDIQPYATNSYSYDRNWNLAKIFISDYPKPLIASYTYQYSDAGVLLNMKYNAKEGANFPDQTEAEFALIREYKYSYRGNSKIELEFRRNVLSDSAVYTYMNNLLVSEFHYDLTGNLNYNIKYEYDSDNKLIKETDSPDNINKTFIYDGTRLIKEIDSDQNGATIMEDIYSYTLSDGKLIVESHIKDFLSTKKTYKDGNIIEEIIYHPVLTGAEWFCYRYDYY